MIQILPANRWHEIEDILGQYDCALPNAGSIVLAETEDGKVKAFIIVEMIAKIGQIWSDGGSPRKLFRELVGRGRLDHSYMILSCEERFDSLCEKFGFYEMPGKVFRRDL